MRPLSSLLLAFSCLFLGAKADNSAIPFEVLGAYYIYRMQYLSGAPRTLALGCMAEPGTGGLCYFDDFVKHIMVDKFVLKYIPSGDDHTLTPTLANLKTFRQAKAKGPLKMKADKVLSGGALEPSSTVAMRKAFNASRFFEKLLAYANQAIDTGRTLVSDVAMVQNALNSATIERVNSQAPAANKWLSEHFTEDEMKKYLKTIGTAMPNWDATFTAIRADTTLTPDQAETLRQRVIACGATFGTPAAEADDRTVNHFALFKSYKDICDQLDNAIKTAPAGSDYIPARTAATECPTDVQDATDDISGGLGGAAGAKRDLNAGSRTRQSLTARWELPEIKDRVLPRQLIPISTSTGGVTTSSTSSSSVSKSSSPILSSTMSSISSLSSTTTSSGRLSTGYDLALTTVYTAPPECTGGVTELSAAPGTYWQDIINPIPGVTLTSCFPSQFYSSALATTTLPPFSQLICPDHWESYGINATYLICCPSGFGLYAPNITNVQRPALSALCTSSVWDNVLVDITGYDTNATPTVVGTSAGNNGILVLATAFDGIMATGTTTSSTSSTATPTSSKPSTTSTVTTSSTSSKPTTTSTVTTSSTSSKPTTTSTMTTSSTSSKPTTTSTVTTSSIPPKTTSTTASTTSSHATTAGPTAISQLPSCGQTCFSNLLGQYSTLGCGSSDPACLCRNVNFGYGIRDCANGACGTAVASTVIAFETSYCASAESARTTFPTTTTASVTSSKTITAIANLPSCGQTCFNNLQAQYSSLGCSSPNASCLCKNVNFGYGIRDCANGACGTAIASTVISFEISNYCASATATQ